MWFARVCVLIAPTISMGMRCDTVEFSVNYFKERNVPFVCLITCENMPWHVKFTKTASSQLISVSKININMAELSYKSMEQCFRQRFTTVGVLVDAQCTNTELIYHTASKNRWFDFKHIWLIVNETNNQNVSVFDDTTTYKDSENSSNTVNTLKVMNISVDADIILASRNGDHFKLVDVFNFGKVQGGDLIVTEIGLWKPEDANKDLFRELNKCKYYKRYDFRQLGLRMISVVLSKSFDPKMLTEVGQVPGVVSITRTSTMALMVVAETHNIKFVHSRTDKWLGTYENNASRAVATALYFEEQDISSVFRYLESLFSRVTLIHPALTSIETRYYYRIPTIGPGKFENKFLQPLSAGTWYCLLVVSAVGTVILVVAARLEARPSSVQYGLFSVTASICQQAFEDGDNSQRNSAARRLAMFVTGTACVIIYNYYTSSVVSWLLNAPPPSITSLEELVDSRLELIFEDVGYTHSWLTVPGYYFNSRNAKIEDVIRQKVLNKKRSTPLLIPLEQGIAMVKAGGYAYHTEPNNANSFISKTFDKKELCELGSLPSIEKVLLYPGVQRNSPYKEFFTWSLTRLQERGIISCIQRRTSPQPVSCEGSSPRALALGGAAPAFILLALGYLLATCIMLVERYIFKMKQQDPFFVSLKREEHRHKIRNYK